MPLRSDSDSSIIDTESGDWARNMVLGALLFMAEAAVQLWDILADAVVGFVELAKAVGDLIGEFVEFVLNIILLVLLLRIRKLALSSKTGKMPYVY